MFVEVARIFKLVGASIYIPDGCFDYETSIVFDGAPLADCIRNCEVAYVRRHVFMFLNFVNVAVARKHREKHAKVLKLPKPDCLYMMTGASCIETVHTCSHRTKIPPFMVRY